MTSHDLVVSNLPLVIHIARDFRTVAHIHRVDFGDMVQAGNLGLMAAAVRFDPGRHVKFGDYAGIFIRSYIKRELSMSRMVRIPPHAANRPNLPMQAWVAWEYVAERPWAVDVNLDAPDIAPAVHYAVSRLSPRSRQVIGLRLGGMTNPEIAIHLGIPWSAVYGAMTRGLKALRRSPELRELVGVA